MKGPQIKLKLFLDKLELPSQINTLNDRITIQKAIYISQKSGADLAYSYGWYVHGPYSPELTKDYFKLANDLNLNDNEFENYELLDQTSIVLEKIKSLLKPPSGLNMTQTDWLELVASILFLLEIHDSDKNLVKEEMKKKKPHLSDFFDNAYTQIEAYELN